MTVARVKRQYSEGIKLAVFSLEATPRLGAVPPRLPGGGGARAADPAGGGTRSLRPHSPPGEVGGNINSLDI